MIRFYLDEDLPPKIAELARASGLDVVSSHEVGRNQSADDVQLHWAASERRCLVTRNRDDFIRLNATFLTNGWTHAGILIVTRALPNHHPGHLSRALVGYASRHEDGLPSYMVDFLSAAVLESEERNG